MKLLKSVITSTQGGAFIFKYFIKFCEGLPDCVRIAGDLHYQIHARGAEGSGIYKCIFKSSTPPFRKYLNIAQQASVLHRDIAAVIMQTYTHHV